MRTKKRVFRSFGYLECDAFAEYLKEMAASGWHFSFPEFTTSGFPYIPGSHGADAAGGQRAEENTGHGNP